MKDYDVCIIGSGAGGGPVALTLAEAGYSVLVLEKGPWFTEKDFFKDELACCLRQSYTPDLKDEQHVIEERNNDGVWEGEPTSESNWTFWNGNCVGGASNFMSGFFHRLKPVDFRLASEFGPIKGAATVDWPISYDDLEPYYAKVEQVVGVSGQVVDHPNQEPRSTKDFPYQPTLEHPISSWIDKHCTDLGYHPMPVPRAVLPKPVGERNGCSYSDYCGSYGCATGAKGSSRAALLNEAIATGKCEVRPHSKVYKLESDQSGKVSSVHYYDAEDQTKKVDAKIYVVACHAIETSRLLLSSTGKKHPDGLANSSGQLGKNLLFSSGGSGQCDLDYADLSEADAEALKVRGPFINRALQDWYTYKDQKADQIVKGGTIEFLFTHPNPISQANQQKWGEGGLVWGEELKSRIKSHFTDSRYLKFETFCDWLPNDNCYVTLDPKIKDKWGSPVANVRIGYHGGNLRPSHQLDDKAKEVLESLGGKNIRSNVSTYPPPNLVAGGCRFGNDPETTVLNADCRAHDVENLYVTDGSFMPTGGSVPYTWTIYANSFRVADKIKKELS
ncbi:MAG: GMC family oxidoreductase [Gammaproteobacteria bacterium]